MRRTNRRPADAGARKWKLIALACFGALAITVAVPQATAHDTNSLAHAVEHVLEGLGVLQGKADAIGAKTSAIKNKTDNLPSSPAGTSDTGTIVTDTFREFTPESTPEKPTLKGWDRNVEGTLGRQFLANITAHCSFVHDSDDEDVNTARIYVRSAVPNAVPTEAEPLQPAPFPTQFEEKSTDGVVTVVTGPVVGFYAPGLSTYQVQCSAGGDDKVAQGMAQAWFQVEDK